MASPAAFPSTCVRRRACVRSPSTSWRALLGCDVYVVRTFARELTWLAHVILRNLLTAKKKLVATDFVAAQKMFKLMATGMAAVLI